jgi:hypothetical protein
MTDILRKFVEANADEFSGEDGVTLKRAFELWNQFRTETGLGLTLAMYKFREELGSYFEEFKERATVNGVVYRSYFSGLKPLT